MKTLALVFHVLFRKQKSIVVSVVKGYQYKEQDAEGKETVYTQLWFRRVRDE